MRQYSILIALVLFSILLTAQQRGFKSIGIVVDGVASELYSQSHALVIGVSDYNNGWSDLPGVARDVEQVKNILEGHDFNVVMVKNADSKEIKQAFDNFISKYSRDYNARLLVFFSGHGYTMKQAWGGDMGYIIPSDAPNPNINPEGFKDKAIDMEMMEVYAKRMDSKHALFMFDCCFSGSIFSMSKAAPAVIGYKTSKPVRQFITAGGADEEVPDESIFCQQFASGLQGDADMNNDGFISGSELGEYLQTTVINYSYNAQHPQYGKIRNPNLDKGDFIFILGNTENEYIATPPVIVNIEPKVVEKKATNTTPIIKKEYNNMVYVEGGTFNMGSNTGQPDEKPIHKVTLTGYYIDIYEATIKDFKRFVDATGYKTEAEIRGFTWLSGKKRKKVKGVSWRYNEKGKVRQKEDDNYPAIFINKNDAEKYCSWLGGRLPTESEWEFAVRGGNKGVATGNTYSGNNDINMVGWTNENSGGKLHKVGEKKPNELGIYDMSGNVFEYCSDLYGADYYDNSETTNPKGPATGTGKVSRGGSWYYNSQFSRNTDRRGWYLSGNSTTGVRCVRDN